MGEKSLQQNPRKNELNLQCKYHFEQEGYWPATGSSQRRIMYVWVHTNSVHRNTWIKTIRLYMHPFLPSQMPCEQSNACNCFETLPDFPLWNKG